MNTEPLPLTPEERAKQEALLKQIESNYVTSAPAPKYEAPVSSELPEGTEEDDLMDGLETRRSPVW